MVILAVTLYGIIWHSLTEQPVQHKLCFLSDPGHRIHPFSLFITLLYLYMFLSSFLLLLQFMSFLYLYLLSSSSQFNTSDWISFSFPCLTEFSPFLCYLLTIHIVSSFFFPPLQQLNPFYCLSLSTMPIFVSFYFPRLPQLKPLYCLSLCCFLLSSPSTFQPFLLFTSFSVPLCLQFSSFLYLFLSPFLSFRSSLHSSIYLFHCPSPPQFTPYYCLSSSLFLSIYRSTPSSVDKFSGLISVLSFSCSILLFLPTVYLFLSVWLF